jgi:hypothetical protein
MDLLNETCRSMRCGKDGILRVLTIRNVSTIHLGENNLEDALHGIILPRREVRHAIPHMTRLQAK